MVQSFLRIDMELRSPKAQEQVRKAFWMIMDLIEQYKEADWEIWMGALWSIFVSGCINSKQSYEFFCSEIERVKIHFKPSFEE
jgi:hypothetical protein